MPEQQTLDRPHVEVAAPQLPGINVPKPRRTGRVTAPRRDQTRAPGDQVGWAMPWVWRIAALVLVLTAFLVPRLSEVDRLVTPDEPIWLARSANYYEAVATGDPGSTYQFAHPGVTVMWLGAAGYWWAARDYPDLVDGQISQRQNRIAMVLEEQGRDPLAVLVAARQMLILGMAVAFALAFLVSLRLLGFWEVTLGFLLIALEPYTIGITRLLHIDGMASVLMLLSVVAGLVYLLRGKRRMDLLISGIAAGLAVLTRSQMGILAVWFVLMLAIDGADWRLQWPGWRSMAARMSRPTLTWGGSAFLTCVALWPAVWVDPIKVLKGMFSFAETAAFEGHERAVFFAGFVYEGDPGWRFYPATFIWRASPATVIGLALAVLVMVLARRWKNPAVQVRIMLGMFVAMASYGLLMSIAAKKFDRYLLPVYPLAALAAAWGLLVLGRRAAAWTPGPRWAPAVVAGTLALAVQMNGAAGTAPYYLSYYSPMLGGATAAPDLMMVGWGEGLDQVADYLNALPDSENIVASTESWRTPLSYFFEGESRFAAFVDDPPGVFRWVNSDYYILYITPLTRNAVWPPFLEYIENKTPVLTVELNGLAYARVYDIRDDPIPPYIEQGGAGMVSWSGIGRMVAVGKVANPGAERGTVVQEIIYFDGIEVDEAPSVSEQFGVRLSMIDQNGVVVSVSEEPLELEDPIRHGLYWTEQSIDIPEDAARGSYRIELAMVDLTTGKLVPGFSFRFGDRLADAFEVDSVFVVGSESELDELPELT